MNTLETEGYNIPAHKPFATPLGVGYLQRYTGATRAYLYALTLLDGDILKFAVDQLSHKRNYKGKITKAEIKAILGMLNNEALPPHTGDWIALILCKNLTSTYGIPFGRN